MCKIFNIFVYFQFFLKATQLESMKHDYVQAMGHKRQAKELLDSKETVSVHVCYATHTRTLHLVGLFGLSTEEPYTIILCSSCVGVGACAHFPCHRTRNKSFIFGIHVHLCSSFRHIKYLVILKCSF